MPQSLLSTNKHLLPGLAAFTEAEVCDATYRYWCCEMIEAFTRECKKWPALTRYLNDSLKHPTRVPNLDAIGAAGVDMSLVITFDPYRDAGHGHRKDTFVAEERCTSSLKHVESIDS